MGFLLAAVPLGILIGLWIENAVNVPYWDEWAFIPLLQKLNSSGVAFSDLWAQHNEHRIFLPRTIMLAMGSLTHWDVRYEMAASLALAVGIFSLLFLLLSRTFEKRRYPFGIAGLVLGLAIFSPAGYENWLWGWQIQWYLNVLALVAVVVLLSSKLGERLPFVAMSLAALGAVFGTLSLASGNFIWVAAAPMILFQRHLRRYAWLFFGIGMISVGTYLRGYHQTNSSSGVDYLLHHGGDLMSFIVQYLGRPFSSSLGVATVAGSILLATFIVVLLILIVGQRDQFARWGPWMCIAMYVGIADLSTGVGRLTLGGYPGLSSRYTSISALMIPSVVACLSVLLESFKRTRGVTAHVLLWGLVGFGLLTSYRASIGDFELRGEQMGLIKECVESASFEGVRCLRQAYPDEHTVYWRGRYLMQIGWGGFEMSTRVPGPRVSRTP
ncbi:MAG TPA: hypothetical protein VI541_03895 [Actinomycetota bacterium]|nr:hypothetical protein [Actinomycetota bacterium]